MTDQQISRRNRSMGLYVWPFWTLTQWGFIRGRFWGYEKHDNYGQTEMRHHWFVKVPLIAMVVLWRTDQPLSDTEV